MTTKMAVWAKLVMVRDNHSCTRCPSKAELVAHHIKPMKAYPELMFDVANGETLCARCANKEYEQHKAVPQRGKKPQRKTLLRIIHQQKEQIAVLQSALVAKSSSTGA